MHDIPSLDPTLRTIEMAFKGLATRSEAISHNVANAEVPGFRASRVSFEEELRQAIDSPGARFSPQVFPSAEAPGANGNNVRLEEEVTAMIKTNLLQQAMVQAFNFKVGVMRTAVRG